MSLLGKLTKFGLAKKAFDEVRKPENQERIRRMAADVANRTKRKPGGTSATATDPAAEARGTTGAADVDVPDRPVSTPAGPAEGPPAAGG